MRGIVGFIVLILGVVILALLFAFVQSKVLKSGQSEDVRPVEIQNQVNELQNKLQEEQNKSLGASPY